MPRGRLYGRTCGWVRGLVVADVRESFWEGRYEHCSSGEGDA